MYTDERKDNAVRKMCETLVTARNKHASLLQIRKYIEEHPEAKEKVWSSFGVLSILLEEIVSSYDRIIFSSIVTPPSTLFVSLEMLVLLSSLESFREVCIEGQIPLFLYPILNSPNRGGSMEEIKTVCFNFINILLQKKVEGHPHPVKFFKNTELVPLCLKNMEIGAEQSKLAAINVFYSIVSIREGLEHTCQTYDRFMAISMILNSMLVQMEIMQSAEILEMIIKTYIKLCGMPNAKIVFSRNRPHMLYSEHIRDITKSSPSIKAAYDEFLSMLQN